MSVVVGVGGEEVGVSSVVGEGMCPVKACRDALLYLEVMGLLLLLSPFYDKYTLSACLCLSNIWNV